MALFKIMRGDSSRISTDVTAFHDGYAYFTPDDGGFYIDAEYNGEQKRYRINPIGAGSVADLLTPMDLLGFLKLSLMQKWNLPKTQNCTSVVKDKVL